MVSFALELLVSSFTHVGEYITLSIETRNSVNLWSFVAILASWGVQLTGVLHESSGSHDPHRLVENLPFWG